jgi:hypothetical protein
MLGNNRKSIGFTNSVYNSKGIVLDPSTIAFITAAGITDPTQINAVNYLTESLKGINKTENPSGVDFFSGCYAIYPFVGGTATQHRYNLRNVAAFLITYGGGVTHNTNGITGNAVNAYGDTGFSPLNNNIPLDDAGIAVYTRTSANVGTELGAGDAALTNAFLLQTRAGGFANTNINSTTFAAVAEAAGTGLFVAVRRNATSMQLYKNGSSIILKTSSAGSSARTANNLYLMCNNINGVPISYSGKNIALALIFEVTNVTYINANMPTLYNIIQQYQTLLSRQV